MNNSRSLSEVLHSIWLGLTGASWLEQIATALGVAGVWLMIRQNVWTFPVGLVQVSIFGYVCFRGRLYSEVALQALFFGALVYGWVHWTRGHSRAHPLPVRWLSRRARLYWMAGMVALWAVWGAAMTRLGAALAYADAFVFAVSVASQWLQARKAIDNWLGWIVANSVAIGVFWLKEYYWFAALYFGFWLMAWAGFFAWRRSMAEARDGATAAAHA